MKQREREKGTLSVNGGAKVKLNSPSAPSLFFMFFYAANTGQHLLLCTQISLWPQFNTQFCKSHTLSSTQVSVCLSLCLASVRTVLGLHGPRTTGYPSGNPFVSFLTQKERHMQHLICFTCIASAVVDGERVKENRDWDCKWEKRRKIKRKRTMDYDWEESEFRCSEIYFISKLLRIAREERRWRRRSELGSSVDEIESARCGFDVTVFAMVQSH